MQFSIRHTSLLRKSTKLFTEEFFSLKTLLDLFFCFKTYARLHFGSIIYLWTSPAYFQPIHKWKNRCSLFNRLFTARSGEYQWPYTIKLYQFFISEARKIGDLPLLYRAVWVRAASNWDTRGQNQCWSKLAWFHKYKWSCAHLYRQQIWEYIHMVSTFIRETVQNQ